MNFQKKRKRRVSAMDVKRQVAALMPGSRSRWLKEFGDSSVYDAVTGLDLGITAREWYEAHERELKSL